MKDVIAHQSLTSIGLVLEWRPLKKQLINLDLRESNRISNAYLQSAAKAPLWSVLSWCSNRVLLLMLGFGAEAAGRFTPLVAGLLLVASAGGASVVLLLPLLHALMTVGMLEESPSIVVSIKVPIGDWMVDCVVVTVMLFVLLLLLQTEVETDASIVGLDVLVAGAEGRTVG